MIKHLFLMALISIAVVSVAAAMASGVNVAALAQNATSRNTTVEIQLKV
jgi:hypothetical protein